MFDQRYNICMLLTNLIIFISEMKVFIYGQIGREVKASETVKAIAETQEAIDVYINSPGGNVYEGMAIFNALQRHGNVSTYVDGLAYSAASWVALAAPTEKRFMAANAQIGIHQAMNFGGGNKKELQAQIEVLERIDNAQIDLYKSSTGLQENQIKDIMSKDTPLSFEEAVSLGFVSGEHTPQKIAALFDTNLNDMFKIDELLTFRKAAKQEEAIPEVKAEVEEKIEAEHKEAETPAQALAAGFTPKKDFEEYKAVTEPFMDTVIEYIKEQPKTDDIKAMIKEAVNASMVTLLGQINSKGSVPQAEETQFAEAKKEETYEPLTLEKNFWEIKNIK